MANFKKRTNYREKYPNLSDEILDVLQRSDRNMEYQEYDLKVERCQVDDVKQTVVFIPSREDSYDRLLDEDKQFQFESESVEDMALKFVMIEKMIHCLKLLTSEEQNLICELFFNGKSEHQLSVATGIPRMTIHDRKVKIFAKLRKLLEK